MTKFLLESDRKFIISALTGYMLMDLTHDPKIESEVTDDSNLVPFLKSQLPVIKHLLEKMNDEDLIREFKFSKTNSYH
ncbi:hypothetical protein ABGN28_08335 [Levilactobacillus brevis]|uniref:hypothetical protein n=1 Tax=Levilactobacillus brevis TaxID=1580 RepID=UPI00063ADDFF|nr:hypothetical protein [Levilactobacillus brevis]KLE29504.1 hypothetical protein AAX72_08190 [Levilactobacillus brevis]